MINSVKQRWTSLTTRSYGCGILLISNLLLLTAVGLFLLAEWYLPSYVGSRLLPQLSAAAGVKGVSAQVRRIGFTGADLANVRLELNGNRSVEVDSLRVDYSLPLLPWRSMRVTAIAVSGLKIKAVWKDGKFTIPGLYPDLLQNTGTTKTEKKKKRLLLEEFRLTHGVFLIETDAAVTEIPFDVVLRQSNGGDAVCNWTISCGDDISSGNLEWNQDFTNIKTRYKGILHPKRYTGVIPGIQRWEGPGTVKYTGDAELTNTASGLSVSGNIDLPQLKMAAYGWTLANPTLTMPVRLHLDWDGKQLNYRLTNLAISGPISAVLDRLDGQLVMGDKELSATGKIMLKMAEGKIGTTAISLQSPLRLEQDYQLQWNSSRKVGTWKLTGATPQRPQAPPALNLQTAAGKLTVPELTWRAGGDLILDEQGLGLGVKADLKLQPALSWTQITRQSGKTPMTIQADVPIVKLAARLNRGEWSGSASIFTATISAQPFNLQGSRIQLLVPIHTGSSAGELSIEDIRLNQKHLADIKLKVTRDADGLCLDGILKQDFLPGADWKCHSQIRFKPYVNGKLELNIDPYTPPEPLALEKYWPNLTGMTFNGQLHGGFEYHFNPETVGGKAFFKLRNGELKQPQNNFALTGIEADLDLPSLPGVQTPPRQRLACRTAQFGKTTVENILADYQFTAEGELLLENFSAGWCGGRLYTHSLRLTPQQQEWQATVYCDGLILSQLIRQLGFAEAEGRGTVYGRIPLRLNRDGIKMEPGFLYSVPGEKNHLKLSSMEHLLAGLPRDSAQFSQLDLAVEALKSFDYEWTRLNFKTEGENLQVSLQLDGKPVNPLPFAWNKGSFIRVNGQSASFQGIQLEVNVAVPLNRLLYFNNQIKNIVKGKM